MNTIKIPRKFYQDHLERDLPTPRAIKETANQVEIELCDKESVKDLYEDAKYYADPIGGPTGAPHLRPSAKRTMQILKTVIHKA